ncbi:MAG TPA: 5-(carboxyamino)imidazole ribonucleotide synthase [Caulobacteraceae bacterium]|nr:5-(carboxyamino)imidazole ribonucleotide synthase [Caulobacteraceae bacterium]
MPAFPLPPGSTIGVLGGGQLGRMLALAAARLGFRTVVLTPETDSGAAQVATRCIEAPYEDQSALTALAEAADVITFEFENVPAAVVAALEALGATVAPGARALAVAQDRVDEKMFLNGCRVPTVAFAACDSAEDVTAALDRLGAPALLKTRRQGYDGKGQTWVESHAEGRDAFARVGAAPSILEARADFVRELSVIAARGRDGDITTYPLGENHHEGGILRRTLAPARVSSRVEEQAEAIAARILTSLDYIGVMGVELFELADGKLLVNEIAPRVHNSGHWTLDGCEVDQFEQHVRAIAGWPLGPVTPVAQVEMENLIGDDVHRWPALIGEEEARLWLYGKGEARPGRKMGHVNRLRPLDRS